MLMLIDERRQRQHSPTFDERLTYGPIRTLLTIYTMYTPPSHAGQGSEVRQFHFGHAVSPATHRA
eukprot:scaffold111407_cov66-Phaeocystis_antarctica.AAC.1